MSAKKKYDLVADITKTVVNKLDDASSSRNAKKTKETSVERYNRRKAEGKYMSDPKKERQMAQRHDALRPAKDFMKSRGWSWPRFVRQRLDQDPRLSRMNSKQRQKMVIKFWEELGQEGFAQRFNL